MSDIKFDFYTILKLVGMFQAELEKVLADKEVTVNESIDLLKVAIDGSGLGDKVIFRQK